ncbi:MAG: CpaF family protein [Candidatus Norongarragalinales archaeon]
MGYFETLAKKAREKKPGAAPASTGKEKPSDDEEKKRVLLDSYGDVKIYKDPKEQILLYEIPVPHFKGGEKTLIDSLVQIAIGVMPPDVASLSDEEKRRRYYNKVLEIIEKTPELNVPVNAKDFYASAVVREMAGYSLIDPLVADDNLEEIMIIGPGKPVYVFHRKYEMLKTNVFFYDDEDIRNLIERIGRTVGRRIDTQVPMLDARLPDGTRVNATIPPSSIDGSTLTLRKFRRDPLSIIDLINFNTLDFETGALLWMATDGLGAYPANILVSGGTASGKTTTLNCLCSFVPNSERIVTIEDTAELNLPLEHWVRLEVRPASLEGSGEITMNDLVKNSIRMRPDRIIVGEIRGEEGYTMFNAMNTGHRGVMGTVHANSAQETLVRLASPPISVPNIMISSLNIVLMQHRIHDRRLGTLRRITEVAEVSAGDPNKPEIQVIYSWDPVKDRIYPTGLPSVFFDSLKRYTGLDDEGIAKELKERESLLKKMAQSGIRDMAEVCKITQGYISRKKLSI